MLRVELTYEVELSTNNFQALAVEDLKKLHQLLDKYCKLVEAGDLCAGDCPNDGVSCSSGVCRAHLR